MAFANSTIWELQPTSGNNANGGGFNPGNTSMATDLTTDTNTGNTSSPVVSSASYNFAARDVGHWLFIKSGTNWTPGWYQIASVASNKATLSAAAGAAVLYTGSYPAGPSTAAGCATVGTPTSGTWSIDYSQSTGIAFTDLATASTTTFTSAGTPIGKNFVGNIVNITSGTGWNTVRWEVSSVSGTTGTAANFSSGTTIASHPSTGGTGTLGGPLATSASTATTVTNINNSVFMKAEATESLTGTVITWQAKALVGYTSVRGDGGLYTLDASGMTAANNTFANNNTDHSYWSNIRINSSKSVAFANSSGHNTAQRCVAVSAVSHGFSSLRQQTHCEAISCGGAGFNNSTICVGCVAIGNTTYGFTPPSCFYCIASHNGSDGMYLGELTQIVGCVLYKNTGDGIEFYGNGSNIVSNNILYGNGGYGIRTNRRGQREKNAYGSNTSGANFINVSGIGEEVGAIALTADPFVDADNATVASRNFALNNTAGGGALLRATGWPNSFRYLTGTAGYNDVGPVQHQDSGGGGGSVIVIEDD